MKWPLSLLLLHLLGFSHDVYTSPITGRHVAKVAGGPTELFDEPHFPVDLSLDPHGTRPGHTSSVVIRAPAVAKNQECDFDSIEKFFEYAYREKLNITAEVQSCQNLCILTYGKGNPDLSGIGMMHAYNLQTALTLLFGPAYRLLQITLSRYYRIEETSTPGLFMSELKGIQSLFFASNGFFILSSAVASLVRLSQNTTIFEGAQMQALAFLQLNSLLVSFFCLARPITRWLARVFFTTIVFVCVVIVLGKSQLSSRRRMNWQQASIGCENGTADFGVITPIPYPPSAVLAFAVAGVLGLFLRSVRASFQGRKRYELLFKFLMALWVLLIALMSAGILVGLLMLWRQRQHLRGVIGKEYEDDVWGFGQVAALFIWAPVPVDLVRALNELAQRKSAVWNNLMHLDIGVLSWKSRKQVPEPSAVEVEVGVPVSNETKDTKNTQNADTPEAALSSSI